MYSAPIHIYIILIKISRAAKIARTTLQISGHCIARNRCERVRKHTKTLKARASYFLICRFVWKVFVPTPTPKSSLDNSFFVGMYRCTALAYIFKILCRRHVFGGLNKEIHPIYLCTQPEGVYTASCVYSYMRSHTRVSNERGSKFHRRSFRRKTCWGGNVHYQTI